MKPTTQTVREQEPEKTTAEAQRSEGSACSWSTFRTGRAEAAIRRAGQWVGDFLARHFGGDWGEVTPEQEAQNDTSFDNGKGYMVSVFRTNLGDRVQLTTRLDHQRTEIILEDEIL